MVAIIIKMTRFVWCSTIVGNHRMTSRGIKKAQRQRSMQWKTHSFGKTIELKQWRENFKLYYDVTGVRCFFAQGSYQTICALPFYSTSSGGNNLLYMP